MVRRSTPQARFQRELSRLRSFAKLLEEASARKLLELEYDESQAATSSATMSTRTETAVRRSAPAMPWPDGPGAASTSRRSRSRWSPGSPARSPGR